MIVEVDDPELGKIKQIEIAIKFSETPGKIRMVALLPGEHTIQILKDLGYDETKIKELKEKGVID